MIAPSVQKTRCTTITKSVFRANLPVEPNLRLANHTNSQHCGTDERSWTLENARLIETKDCCFFQTATFIVGFERGNHTRAVQENVQVPTNPKSNASIDKEVHDIGFS